MNPHAWTHLDVRKPDGSVDQRMVDGGTPNPTFRRRLTKESLLPGTVIVVSGFQAKNGSLGANGRDLRLRVVCRIVGDVCARRATRQVTPTAGPIEAGLPRAPRRRWWPVRLSL